MRYALVAGGAGFIGSHIVKGLLNKGVFVICVDNLITGQEENIEQFQNRDNFIFLNLDLTESIDSSLRQFEKIDYIFHMASPASPNEKSDKSYMTFPIETLLVNSIGTYNLLNVARAKNSRFLFASTSEVYGDPEVSPQPETYWGNVNPAGPRSVYDEGKRFGEAVTMAYHREFDLDVRLPRIFNTYGESMRPDDGRVVSNFIVQALRDEPITIFGDGSQTRSFCYISDLVDGLLEFMMRDSLAGEIINLGNPLEHTVLEIAEKIKKLTNSNSKIIYEKLPEDDPKIRKPDISKAKELLDYSPKVGIDEGFQRTIEHFQKII